MRFPVVSVPVTAVALLMAAPAQADPACEPLVKAMRAFSDQPGIRQDTYEKDKIHLQSISLKDAMYLREGGDGPWRKMPFDLEKRRQMAEEALKSMPPSDCQGPRTETLAGVVVDIYSYKQPNPMKPGQFISSSLWIGRAASSCRRRPISRSNTARSLPPKTSRPRASSGVRTRRAEISRT